MVRLLFLLRLYFDDSSNDYIGGTYVWHRKQDRSHDGPLWVGRYDLFHILEELLLTTGSRESVRTIIPSPTTTSRNRPTYPEPGKNVPVQESITLWISFSEIPNLLSILIFKRGRTKQAVLSASRLFLTYCNCQPLPLFHHESFFASTDARDIELLDAIQGLALRFSDGGITDPNIEQQIRFLTESCRKRVMDRIANGTVELSTLQALCLLTLIEHTGIVIRASWFIPAVTDFLPSW